MSMLVELIFPLCLMILLLALLTCGGCALWACMPERGHATLKQALLRVVGRQASHHREGQIYTVRIDGQLRYASAQDDVQHFLLVTMTTASRQVLRVMTDNQPATLVFTCGTESVVIEVHQT